MASKAASVHNSIADIQSHLNTPNHVTVNSRDNNGVICEDNKAKTKWRRFTYSVITAILLCLTWTTCCVSTSRTYNRTVYEVNINNATSNATPFLLSYCSTSLLLLCYPIYLIVVFFKKPENVHLYEFVKHDKMMMFDEEQSKWSYFTIRCFIFGLLWKSATYCLFRSLYVVSVMDFIAIYNIKACFVYLFNWILLSKKFVAMRILALFVAYSGAIMYFYLDTTTMGYKIIAVISAALFSMYKIIFKKLVFCPSTSQQCLFLTVIGICNILMMWPLVLVLSVFTNVEPISTLYFPWKWFFIAIIFHPIHCMILFAFRKLASKMMINLGTILAIPLSYAVETYWLPGVAPHFSNMKIFGISFILLSFFMIVLPENWYAIFVKLFQHYQRKNRKHEKRRRWKQRHQSHSNIYSAPNETNGRLKSIST